MGKPYASFKGSRRRPPPFGFPKGFRRNRRLICSGFFPITPLYNAPPTPVNTRVGLRGFAYRHDIPFRRRRLAVLGPVRHQLHSLEEQVAPLVSLLSVAADRVGEHHLAHILRVPGAVRTPITD